MPVFRADLLQNVKGKGVFQIRGVDVNHVVDSACRNEFNDFFHQLAVGIDYGHATAVLNILDDHIFQGNRFAHAGFAQQVHVPAPVVGFNAKFGFLVSEIGFGESYNLVIGHI